GAACGVLRTAAAGIFCSALSAGGGGLGLAGGGGGGRVYSGRGLAGGRGPPAPHGRGPPGGSRARGGRVGGEVGWGAGVGGVVGALVVSGVPGWGGPDPEAAEALTAAQGPWGARGAFAGPRGWSGRPALAGGLVRWTAAPADRLPPPHELLHILLA